MADQLFEISLKLMLIDKDEVLCLQRRSHSGDLFWDLPGGRIQVGEIDPLSCLRRECSSELGGEALPDDAFQTRPGRVVDFSIWPGAGEYSPKGIVYYLLSMAVDIDKIVLSDEHAGVGFLASADLRDAGDILDGARLEPELRTRLLGVLTDNLPLLE